MVGCMISTIAINDNSTVSMVAIKGNYMISKMAINGMCMVANKQFVVGSRYLRKPLMVSFWC